MTLTADDSLDAEDLSRLKRAIEYAADVLEDVENSPAKGPLKRDLNDNESMLAWAVDYLNDMLIGLGGINRALAAQPQVPEVLAIRKVLAEINTSLTDGCLFRNWNEPLNEYSKRVLRVVLVEFDRAMLAAAPKGNEEKL